MENVLISLLLAVLAFGLGSCPFSVWIGQRFLGKDIRDYGDGNPGAANVYVAGGEWSLLALALALDVAKGVPFVVLAWALFRLPEPAFLAIGLSAVLGHAFSPMLRFKGGKAIAISFGVLVALPWHTMFLSFAVSMLLGFLVFGDHPWTIMLGPVGSLAYLIAREGDSWYLVFMFCLLALLATKHATDLKAGPRPAVLGWIRGTQQ